MQGEIQILIAKYVSADEAKIALKKLQASKENQGVEITDAAVVSRAEIGELQIHETEDVTGGRGATVGGILGGVLGIIAGPAGVIAGAALGAAVGGAAASVIDTGIPHKRLQEIGAALEPPHAALVVLTEAGFLPFLETIIGGSSVEFLIETRNPEAVRQVELDREVALKALRAGDALASGGMVSPNTSE